MDPYNSLGQIKQRKFKNTSSMNISTEKEKKRPSKKYTDKASEMFECWHSFIYISLFFHIYNITLADSMNT